MTALLLCCKLLGVFGGAILVVLTASVFFPRRTR